MELTLADSSNFQTCPLPFMVPFSGFPGSLEARVRFYSYKPLSNWLHRFWKRLQKVACNLFATFCNPRVASVKLLQPSATPATPCNPLQPLATLLQPPPLLPPATPCNPLQPPATSCNPLQPTANTLQPSTTPCNPLQLYANLSTISFLCKHEFLNVFLFIIFYSKTRYCIAMKRVAKRLHWAFTLCRRVAKGCKRLQRKT